MTADQQPDLSGVSALLQLEAMARSAESIKALQFLIVNETRKLVPFRQAFCFKSNHPVKRTCKLVAASSISVIDRNAPFVRWLERALDRIFDKSDINTSQKIDSARCPDDIKAGWKEYSLPFVLWCPLLLPDGTFIGGIWLARESPWQEEEATLVKRLADTYAHAWLTLTGKKNLLHKSNAIRTLFWLTVLLLIGISFIPVRLSALAPVEIIAKDPIIVSAPMDGVIADILVPPNTKVAEGDLIILYEDTNLRNQFKVAEKTLSVAMAEYHKTTQGAFQDAKSKAQIALLKSQVELNETKRDYARELLDQVEISAEEDGLLIYTDESDWIGRPVKVGQRIMEIADPEQIELRIDLAVDDAIVLKEDAEVKVFLDVDPLNPLSAIVTHASYNAEIVTGDVLAYRIDAEFDQAYLNLRIGLQGTAKIYGETVTLFFSSLRQFIGI
jgi:hypothetical protein